MKTGRRDQIPTARGFALLGKQWDQKTPRTWTWNSLHVPGEYSIERTYQEGYVARWRVANTTYFVDAKGRATAGSARTRFGTWKEAATALGRLHNRQGHTFIAKLLRLTPLSRAETLALAVARKHFA